MPIRFRDDDDSSTRNTVLGVLAGALAGFAVGMIVAQKFGGIEGLTSNIRRRVGRGRTGPADEARPDLSAEGFDGFDEGEEDELEDAGPDELLEDHVLEAFQNDPILCERGVDIGAIGDGVIELAGSVETEEEAKHAVTLARGVPGVSTVVNRLAIGDDEHRFEDASRRAAAGDPSLTETHWEGNTVGTGKRRQGTSKDVGRHADPKVDLQERWSTADRAIQEAAADTDGTAGGAARGARSARVPKADHTDQPDV